ncbi:unnamed protein product [Didymodactylos carnosus]|uniref:Uncharacterized protein n=1 Tax=Didymodactylos carnosus TaxID=1234261 RepID=A0A8S2EER1_9BILA|nr:unnamed protein product [Didymodactylos carnosus]CAF4015586.1 unnamed protein product [Didymodactylos carnosus]
MDSRIEEISTIRCANLPEFGESIGIPCRVDNLDSIDSLGVKRTLHCYLQSGLNNGLSKGLLEISKEDDVKLPKEIKLDELRTILSDHFAFKNVKVLNVELA